MRRRYCVIGAGPAGLVAVRQFKKFAMKVDCFERKDDVGGFWKYSPKAGESDENMSAINSETINFWPKDLFVFESKSYPSEETKTFLKHDEVQKYIQSYYEKHKMHRFVKFNQEVVQVKNLNNTAPFERWAVTVVNKKTNETMVYEYDAVVIATGKKVAPNIPALPGIEFFKGKAIHFKNYNSKEDFSAQQSVVVIGGGVAALDMLYHLKDHVQKIFWSHHNEAFTQENSCLFPKKIEQVPDVERIDGSGRVHLKAGFWNSRTSPLSPDAIVYCTGYDVTKQFSYLDKNIEVEFRGPPHNATIEPLYQQIQHMDYPSLFFINQLKHVANLSVLEIQARYMITCVMGKLAPKSRRKMERVRDKEYARLAEMGYQDPKYIRYMYLPKENDRMKVYTDALCTEARLKKLDPNVVKMIVFHDNNIRTARPLTFRDAVWNQDRDGKVNVDHKDRTKIDVIPYDYA